MSVEFLRKSVKNELEQIDAKVKTFIHDHPQADPKTVALVQKIRTKAKIVRACLR